VPGNRVGIDVEGCGIRHVASDTVRHNGDVIAYLLIVWKTCLRIEHITGGDVRRPCQTTVCAPGIKELGIDVVATVARVVPDHIDASIGRYCQRAKPVPIVLRVGIVVDANRRAKGLSIVGAAREHNVGRAPPARQHTCEHVNVIVSRTARTIDCYERLPAKSYSIYTTLNQVATKVDLSNSVESWRDVGILCVGRADAIKRRASSGDKEIAVRIHVHSSVIGRVGNINRSLPGHAAGDGTIKLSGVARKKTGPELVYEAMAHAIRRIDGKPLLVASVPCFIGRLLREGLAPIGRAPQIVAKK